MSQNKPLGLVLVALYAAASVVTSVLGVLLFYGFSAIFPHSILLATTTWILGLLTLLFAASVYGLWSVQEWEKRGQSPFSALDFIARLTVLVPRPRLNPTRFHGDMGLPWARRLTQ